MAQPLTGRLLGSEREHGSRAKGFSAGRSNRDFFFLLPSLYADTNSLKNISCGQERGTLLTAARCARAQGLPWVCISLLGSRLLLLESPGRLPQALLPARRWDGMGWQPSSPHLHALPRFSILRQASPSRDKSWGTKGANTNRPGQSISF